MRKALLTTLLVVAAGRSLDAGPGRTRSDSRDRNACLQRPCRSQWNLATSHARRVMTRQRQCAPQKRALAPFRALAR